VKIAKNSENVNDRVSENLFQRTRIQLAFSTEEVARAAEVDHETVLKIELMPQLVSLNELYAVANCLNLDPGCVLEFLHASVVFSGAK
jgi:hypothetical protein